ESTKFHDLRRWLAGALDLRADRVNVKYLGTPKNAKNRLTESAGLQPDLTLALAPADQVPTISRIVRQLVGTGGFLKTVAISSRDGTEGWTVVEIAQMPGAIAGARLVELFPLAKVH